MARRLKSLKVDKLALCRRGKNGFGVLYKSADLDSSSPNFSIEMLCKGMDEQGLLTAVVYATNVFGDALRDLLDPRRRT